MTQLQLDGSKIQHHVKELNAWRRGDTVYPLLVEISPTNICNHGCLFCAYDYMDGRSSEAALDRSNSAFIGAERLMKVISELHEVGTKSLFYSGEGEPLLHKRLPEIIAFAGNLGLDQALNTNGSALTGDVIEQILPHMSWVRFSVNGVNEADYAFNHRTSPSQFKLVIDNIKAAAEFKGRHGLPVTLGIQCVHMGQEPEEIFELAQRFKELGGGYFSLKQFNEHPANPYQQKTTPVREDFYQLLELNDSSFQAHVRMPFGDAEPKRPYKSCLALPFFAEIVADGQVFACGPHLGEAAFSYGNIYDDDFRTLWSAGNRAKVENHVQGIDDLDHVCMPNCRLNEVNKFLWNLAHPPEHVNFI
ncbi:MAG: radical SAM protein [Rhodospirillaceae bacterium]|jgi:GTP 3',8-cyclase|nr:radical SAM protein [Rhodospirillaceae bacterium]MBT3925616.1 radical SAM protein [Rhodospirillaceae bacterium]MBT5037223.1 radical SAM protein [Rhodospirillaceae bacterium]MBT5674095.1 radical SAM protein [Rhodospirillaceae bacterium]MBT5778342.1 radical SAM protein [Rhodospirillaceae bacterium]